MQTDGTKAKEYSAAPWLVVAFCADWCGTCRDYRPGFDALATSFPDATFVWIDIEDEAALAEDYDVEDFPTILIQRGDSVLFYGTMLPHVEQLKRLLETLRAQTEEESREYAAHTEERRVWQALDFRKVLRAAARND